MYRYIAIECDDTGSFTRELNRRVEDGWELENSGMVRKNDYCAIWWGVMKKPVELGD